MSTKNANQAWWLKRADQCINKRRRRGYKTPNLEHKTRRRLLTSNLTLNATENAKERIKIRSATLENNRMKAWDHCQGFFSLAVQLKSCGRHYYKETPIAKYKTQTSGQKNNMQTSCGVDLCKIIMTINGKNRIKELDGFMVWWCEKQ